MFLMILILNSHYFLKQHLPFGLCNGSVEKSRVLFEVRNEILNNTYVDFVLDRVQGRGILLFYDM